MSSERRSIDRGIVVLSGGLGGARLALAMSEAGLVDRCTFVTNVADDWTVGDLPVCPDTDAVLYALSGRFDDERGWGIRGDVFPGARAGEPTWFGIGDADRAHHRVRRSLLSAGSTRSQATASLAAAAGITAKVTPVTDDEIHTRVRHSGRWVAFQEWLVRDRCPPPDDVCWDGLDRSSPAPGVVEAITGADLVLIASSSPVASLEPILGVSGVRQALTARAGPTVALSPVVQARPLTTERDRHRAHARALLMAWAGLDHTPGAVARWVAPLASHVAIDPRDSVWADAVRATGAEPVLAPVIGLDTGERRALVDAMLAVAGGRQPVDGAPGATAGR